MENAKLKGTNIHGMEIAKLKGTNIKRHKYLGVMSWSRFLYTFTVQ
jgi:hypothetical protein